MCHASRPARTARSGSYAALSGSRSRTSSARVDTRWSEGEHRSWEVGHVESRAFVNVVTSVAVAALRVGRDGSLELIGFENGVGLVMERARALRRRGFRGLPCCRDG